jgi:hypothetical protein
MPRNSRALLSAEIRTAANRGPPRPMLSWASCRFGASSLGLIVNRLPGPRPFVPEKPNSTSPSPSEHSGVSRPGANPVPKNRTRDSCGSEEPVYRLSRFRRT